MEIIKLENIDKKMGDKEIFKDFSITVQEGDYVSITGPSGRGKTTLLNIMGMLEKPDNGVVEICGKRNPEFISNETREIRRNQISYLFQNYGLVDTDTVEQNLKMVLKHKKGLIKSKSLLIETALQSVGLSGFGNRKVFTLSGGEQQRVALAKIILKNPSVILADEPTGSLDSENRDYVMKILHKLNEEGKTIVVVTHDKEVASSAKRHIHL